MSLIIAAAQFAAKAHDGQTRKHTGRPYIEHPMRVAGRVSIMADVDEPMVAAAWLHDVIEDCGITAGQLHNEHKFPSSVALLVEDLTNRSKQHPTLPRAMRKQMDRDWLRGVTDWAKIIKLIDRIDNLREMRDAPADFKALYAGETMLLLPCLQFNDPIYQQLRHEAITCVEAL